MVLVRSDSVSYFVKVRTLIVSADPELRNEVSYALQAKFGRGDVIEADGIEAAAKALKEDKFDVIVADSHLADFFFARFCREMRVGRLGPHPFPIVCILISRPDPEVIRKVVDCGPDDILVLPLQPGQLVGRLEGLSKTRKPFVVTRDYTGPNRRSAPREGAEVIPEIPVPNPLASKIRRVSERTLEKEIEAASRVLANLRLRRQGVQLQWLARTINETILRQGGTNAQVLAYCQEMLDSLNGLGKVGGTLLTDELGEISKSVATAAAGIQKARGDFDIRLLDQLVEGANQVAAVIDRLFPERA